MSESLLKALIRLFVIIAKEDRVTEDEKNTIHHFLNDHLSDQLADKYFKLFLQLAEGIEQGTYLKSLEEENKEIQSICTAINQELAYHQKYVLILELVELIVSDGEISDGELEILITVAESIKIPKETVDIIIAFESGKNPLDFDSEHFLLVTSHEIEVKDGVKQLKLNEISGFFTVLRLPNANLYFLKYIGQSNITINGNPLRPNVATVFASGATVKGEHLTPIYYGDLIGKFKLEEQTDTISFEARDISYKFPNGAIGLQNVVIREERGKLIALMGASGAGKSTLLNVLNGNEKPYQGEVIINGINIYEEPEKMEGMIGYVPQDDLLIEELTVYENLYFAAKLCFSNKSQDEINELVKKTLTDLGLQETADLKVGSPLEKTISGGQRKRLNIGLELLRAPGVLFVDEPTSGLSSRDSENIMDLLKELSLEGKMVFVVIHQPSSDIFKMFDKLVILDVGGYQIFYGNPVDSIIYFKNRINMVDSEEGECPTCGNVNPEQVFNIIETKVLNEYGRPTPERKVSPKKWNEFFNQYQSFQPIKHSVDPPSTNLKIPNWVSQVMIFTKRDFLAKLANRQYLLINLLEAPLLAALLAFIVRYYPASEPEATYLFSDNINIPAYFFISIIVALFMGLTMSAEEIIKDRKILKRESFLHLSRSSYLSSKLIILFGFSAIQTLAYVLIGDFILEIDGMNFYFWAILFTTACFANLLGLNISAAFNSAVTIYILIPILLIPQLMLSGVVVKFDYLNPTISNVKNVPLVGDIMTSRWAFEAYMVAQYTRNDYNKYLYPMDRKMAQAEYMSSFYLVELEKVLAESLQLYNTKDRPEDQFENNLQLLQNEVSILLKKFGEEQFPDVDYINPQYFDLDMANQLTAFFLILRRVYDNEFLEHESMKERVLGRMTDTPQKNSRFTKLKQDFQNKAIGELVRNTQIRDRVVREDGRLIQKIYPIYMAPNQGNIVDYRAPLFSPEKMFFGVKMDTFWFNLLAIWIMTIVLYTTLYFDLLRRLLRN
ncbi:MAG: ATP-binding cassette domain-containing protein [Cyclobacteriaceae bacterium]|nr:ATP-binding cassette domain-containing protein [Cyclobacteriaceae bacterium]MCH8515722.1 ATP-binding cassette domain-containing protein [Cyclobacteriaceae bacterium]